MDQQDTKPAAADVLLQDLENAVASGDEILASLIEHSFHVLGDQAEGKSSTGQPDA